MFYKANIILNKVLYGKCLEYRNIQYTGFILLGNLCFCI